MTQQDVQRGLNLIRYSGVVITLTVFVTMLAVSIVIGQSIDGATGVTNVTGWTFSALLPYTIGFTVMAAILSVIVYFGYRTYAMGRVPQQRAQGA